jgi:hypothetical protein
VVQKFLKRAGEKLDGFPAESPDLAGRTVCFTIPRNDAQGLSQSKTWGVGGYEPGYGPVTSLTFEPQQLRTGLEEILHPFILRPSGVILRNAARFWCGPKGGEIGACWQKAWQAGGSTGC